MVWNRKPRRAFFSRPQRMKKPPPSLRYHPDIVRPLGDPNPLQLPEPYAGLASDPMTTLAQAEWDFGAAQVSSGWDIINSGQGVQTASDFNNVWAALGFQEPTAFEQLPIGETPDIRFGAAAQEQQPEFLHQPEPMDMQAQPPPVPPEQMQDQQMPFGPPGFPPQGG